jgi:hypothetical protein
MQSDNKDFGPAFGLAWSPQSHSDWLGDCRAMEKRLAGSIPDQL